MIGFFYIFRSSAGTVGSSVFAANAFKAFAGI